MTDALRAKYEQAGQGHVFTYWDKLSDSERAELTAQLERIDPAQMNAIVRKALEADAAAREAKEAKIEPPPADSFVSTVDDAARAEQLRSRGLAPVGAGQVGVLLLAGGQGTRLGSSAPKGSPAR